MLIEIKELEDTIKVQTALMELYPDIQDGKTYDVEIKKHRKKRSLDANGYLWVLCQEIAKKIHSTKEEVYRAYIKDYGDFTDICIQDKDLEQFCNKWKSQGLGWIYEVIGESKVKKCTNLRIYSGSSTYDTQQMSRLIDAIVTDAKELGIDTRTPSEIAEMKSLWGVE